MAQIDTISTNKLNLKVDRFLTSKRSYAVFITDSIGNRLSNEDIWERDIYTTPGEDRNSSIHFTWKVISKDSLLLEANGLCEYPSWKPLEYVLYNKTRQKRVVRYQYGQFIVQGKSRKTKADTLYTIPISFPAYFFPMDLELIGLLPIEQEGQQFIIPFYEPGALNANYYKFTVVGREKLKVGENKRVNCWKIKLDYSDTAYSLFWISRSYRETLRVIQPRPTGSLYKIKL